jgi:RNA polymerase sigma factor (sigma-70 family)
MMASVAAGLGSMRQIGGQDAFERLFICEYARVVAVADRIVNDPDEAEDVAQEVFAEFHRRHAADAPYAAPWLYRAAVHTALNVIRGRRRRVQRETRHELDAARLSSPRSDAADPLQVVEVSEIRCEVRAALARLPARSAAILALRYGGMSYQEISSVLGVKVSNIGTLLRRAEVALRKEVEHAASR